MVNVTEGRDRGAASREAAGAVHTVACISFSRSRGFGTDAPSSTVSAALDEIRQAIRADDRICPMATSCLAIEFGALASRIQPQVLADRVARAVGGGRTGGTSTTTVATSVGVAQPEPHRHAADVTRRALSAARAGSSFQPRLPLTGDQLRTVVVTVDLLVIPGSPTSDPDLTFQSMHRRNVHFSESGIRRDLAGGYEPGDADPGNVREGADRSTIDQTVLVVDPHGAAGNGPGLAAQSALSVADQMGCRTAAVVVAPGDPLTLTFDGTTVDLVVLALDGGWTEGPPSWTSGNWGGPARVTTSFRVAGVPILVVSVGAGAGALASCVAQGAIALFGLDQLPDALRSMPTLSGNEALKVAEMNYSERFRALVGLTTSERRVLYYLTQGWAAQDMAEELVVSLTTVRSHIKSVLRKLGVRSQLAAVAAANSRDLRYDPPGTSA